MTKCGIELDKKVRFCFIKLFWGVGTKLEFYLPYLCHTLKANALTLLNCCIDRIFIPIPGMQFELIP